MIVRGFKFLRPDLSTWQISSYCCLSIDLIGKVLDLSGLDISDCQLDLGVGSEDE